MENQWYELWMNQNKEFFNTTQKNLQGLFGADKVINPEEHLNQINQWLEQLKKQYQMVNVQQKYQTYWQLMSEIYIQACDLMLKEWMNRTKENNPIKDTHDLYELWLNCCHEEYKKAMHTDEFQKVFVDSMNATFKFWSELGGKNT
jgi:hypothetical protein